MPGNHNRKHAAKPAVGDTPLTVILRSRVSVPCPLQVVHGGTDLRFREASARFLRELPFDGCGDCFRETQRASSCFGLFFSHLRRGAARQVERLMMGRAVRRPVWRRRFAVGGSLGKTREDLFRVLGHTMPLLPRGSPTHLLGIGDPLTIEGCARSAAQHSTALHTAPVANRIASLGPLSPCAGDSFARRDAGTL